MSELRRCPLAIVGPTATGKTALAVGLAQRFPTPAACEIISADAMAVYRRMDIGTAKPSAEELAAVPHHCVDVADPAHDYNVAQYQVDANAALGALERAGRVAIVVGGTGLYVRAIVDNFTMPAQFPEERDAIEAEPDTGALWEALHALDPVAAAKILPTNRRRVVRALEVTKGSGKPFSSFGPGVDHYPPTRFCLVGLEIDRDEMDRRIDARYERQLAAGLLAEVEALLRLGVSRTAAQALGYKELFAHLRGEMTLDEALNEARRRTKKFARRQQRWFRRDPRITWFESGAPDLEDRVGGHWERHGADPDTSHR